MQSSFIVTIFLLLIPLSFGESSDLLDSRYGHVNPSCVNQPITQTIFLDDLLSQQRGIFDSTENLPLTVECGYRVIAVQGNTYNLANGLEVYGELEFQDDPNSDKETVVEAPYILVRGHLQAGTEENPFKSKLRFILTEFQNEPENHYNLTVDSLSSNELFSKPMNLGDKAFVVYGGTVSLCGPPENVIAKLAKTVKSGGTQKIFVKGDWTKSWKSGDHIIITGTRHAKYWGNPDPKELTLSSLKVVKRGKWTRLNLSESFYIQPDAVSSDDYAMVKVKIRNFKGKKKKFHTVAEVFKLTKNIVIQGIPIDSDMADFIGTDFSGTDQNSRGGHFVVAHTPRRQIIQSVEFSAMGQAGILGRYPIHFHSCGDIDKETILQYNSIHHSKQRCVVVHATNGLTIKENAAFWAFDNCFMTEDGTETENTFEGNIAAKTEKGAFWMAHPGNDLMNNVATDALNGFEYAEGPINAENFSVKHEIPCEKLPGDYPSSFGCTWARFIPMGKNTGNVAHNVVNAISIYPPRQVRDPQTPDVFKKFFAWNVNIVFDALIDNVLLTDLTVTGARFGIFVKGGNVVVKRSVFHEVCEGLILNVNGGWNDQHSGVQVLKSVYDGIWKNDGTLYAGECAPIMLNNWGATSSKYMFTSSQIRNVKLYNVPRLFITKNKLEDNYAQLGFFVYNILSFDSDMGHIAPQSGFEGKQYQPSYIVRHGYSTTNFVFDGEDSLVKNCVKSKFGGDPSEDQFFFCEGQCWRPIVIIYEKVLGDAPISLRMVTESNDSFFLKEPQPSVVPPCWRYKNYVHLVQILPVGKYLISFVDTEMNDISEDVTENIDIKLYYGDQKGVGFDYDQGCSDGVILELNGNTLPVSDFKECGHYADF